MAGDAIPAKVAVTLYKQQMIALRAEALELAERDGGTLSAANSEAFQRRIGSIERAFHRRVRDYNPYVYRQIASARP